MLQIKWITLSLRSIPLIGRQTRKVIQLYNNLREQVNKGDFEAFQRLSNLKMQVQKRTEDFDKFYSQNSDEESMIYLQSDIDEMFKIICSQGTNLKISETCVNVPWKIIQNLKKNQLSSAKTSRKSVSPLKQSKVSNMKNSNYSKNSVKDFRQISTLASRSKQKKNNIGDIQYTESQKQNILVVPKAQNLKKEAKVNSVQLFFNKGNQRIQLQQLPQIQKLQISFNNKEIFNEEISTVFTFKMTKRDYDQIMKAKKKKKH